MCLFCRVIKHLKVKTRRSGNYRPRGWSLYFPQTEYTETVYVGQSARTPLLQLHSLLDSDTERPHFHLCWTSAHKVPVYSSWFIMDLHSGVLSLNKTLEESDFALLNQKSWSVQKLFLRTMVLNSSSSRSQCSHKRTARIILDFVNASVPQCGQTDLKELCFPHRDASIPHVMENRFPGALRHCGEYPAPFAVNDSTWELIVTAPLDREENERYRLLLLCTIRTDSLITKLETPLDVFVNDEDDNAPFINGTEQRHRHQLQQDKGGSFGTLYVYDRDLTPIYPEQSQNKYVWTSLNSDPWIKETFDLKGTFREKKNAVGGIRETVHDYQLVLKRSLFVNENRSVQLHYLVNDTTYPGLRGTVLLHFNVTVLPVQILFPNVTQVFTVSRRASVYAQVGRVCVENCPEFDGFSVSYRLELPDRNMSSSLQSCYSAISVSQASDVMWGLLFVNDTEPLGRPECQELLYTVVAQEEHTQEEASAQVLVMLEGDASKALQESQEFSSCAGNKRRGECESARGLGATNGRCQWRQGTERGISESYSTCSPDLRTCPDSFCDAGRKQRPSICPQDCTKGPVVGGHERGIRDGIQAGYGTCYCLTERCFCEKEDDEVAICDDMCKTIIATALLLSFIVSILLSSYFIHRYHKNSPKPPIASAEMTFRRPAQAYPISFPANNVRRGSQESIETDTFKIPEDPKWEFPRKNLVLGKTLGEGEFGKVVKATAFRLKGKAGYTTVAVKMLKENASHSELRDLLSEFTLLKQVNHPHVIKMFGACSQDGPLYLIVEYAKFGSLRNFLRESRKVGPSYMGRDANRNSSYLENPDDRR
ncbi:hypothetical protein WMY93_018464 [Mugilogobius chulae]|uniref:Proto-oncogene tyrosine-protein kinase receptor Ret n=1 Tax=Mugilogobius chulae TaxID=88201 RepID=A0AAW0NU45_9GOBI